MMQNVNSVSTTASGKRWSLKRAEWWYETQPWLVGANYVPASAGNQLEMWQEDSFDPALIARELGWARSLGMNTMRVFLIDLLWTSDPVGFRSRIDKFLSIAAAAGIKPLFVLFDSCWDPDPRLGLQRAPVPGVHNSSWLQSPGERALGDPSSLPLLRAYVQGVVGAFADDPRILGWDLWNEPCNPGNPHQSTTNATEKEGQVTKLLPLVFDWARSQHPTQPLTSGLWQHNDWTPGAPLTAIEKVQLARSDIVSFHNYGDAAEFSRKVAELKLYGRPVICTEYLARCTGSTIDAVLPVAKREHVGMFNWGLVEGRTQTTFPWDSWVQPYVSAPPVSWFHDLLRGDGTPYCAIEAATFRRLTGAPKFFVPLGNA